MRRFTAFGLLLFCLLISVATLFAQRVKVEVPKVNPADITIDGKMDEAAWNDAAKADVVTSTSFNGWFNYYNDNRKPTEPDYVELTGRMLYAKDTLYVFIHIKDVVNDSTGLYFPGNEGGSHWAGDQLFVDLSSRLGTAMDANYQGMVYAAPEGPYHFLIEGPRITLNDSAMTGIPDEWRKFPTDSQRVFNAYDICRGVATTDSATGVWNVEMAIYNPDIVAGSSIGFNFGGSQGSRKVADSTGDAYAYWTWQPNVPDDPYAVPPATSSAPGLPSDPGGYNLINSDLWALLHFTPDVGDTLHPQVNVPRVDPSMITIDGKMDEAAWAGAAKADVVTSTSFNGWFNYYNDNRKPTEPDYVELTGRMLWSMDTLYAFIHIKDVVNDSTGLYFPGNEGGSHWAGDQLFVGLSSRLGTAMDANYQGMVYAAPEGPYHFLIEGPRITLNDSAMTGIPDEWRKFPADSQRVFDAYSICRGVATTDSATGVWNVEMAIYNPDIAAGSSIGFNFGGSQGSRRVADSTGDAYAYWTWQPNVPDDPYAVPPATSAEPGLPSDPGGYNLINSDLWALLNLDSTLVVTSVRDISGLSGLPVRYTLSQNYPNPFNPSTKINFSLPHAGKVGMQVYNVLGQLVATLANQQYAAGTYELTWNASHLASGLYFYRMTVDNKVVDTKKMMLLK